VNTTDVSEGSAVSESTVVTDSAAESESAVDVDELIVLVGDDGTPIGTAPKLATHHRDTPLHLAFSCYVFGPDGRFLLTRRALTKKTWPGTWTNSCCGHPAPGESTADAVVRRLRNELGLEPDGVVVPLLPDFRYRAELDGIVENEICPVFGVRVSAQPEPNPHEVDSFRWVAWSDVLGNTLDVPLSPWARLQIASLEGLSALDALRA
jgi:isopentenyl-diphosphate delta-isomerase